MFHVSNFYWYVTLEITNVMKFQQLLRTFFLCASRDHSGTHCGIFRNMEYVGVLAIEPARQQLKPILRGCKNRGRKQPRGCNAAMLSAMGLFVGRCAILLLLWKEKYDD